MTTDLRSPDRPTVATSAGCIFWASAMTCAVGSAVGLEVRDLAPPDWLVATIVVASVGVCLTMRKRQPRWHERLEASGNTKKVMLLCLSIALVTVGVIGLDSPGRAVQTAIGALTSAAVLTPLALRRERRKAAAAGALPRGAR